MKRKRENYIGDNVKNMNPKHTLKEGYWTKPHLDTNKESFFADISEKEINDIAKTSKSSKKEIKEFLNYLNKKSESTVKKYLKVKKCKYREHCLCSSGMSEAVMTISEKCPYFIDWEQHTYSSMEELKYYKKNREQRVICSLPRSIEFIVRG